LGQYQGLNLVRDLKNYAKQTQNRLLLGLLTLILTLGLGLIWFLYGLNAALMGLVCVFGLLILILFILFILNSMERISKS
jgi:hypothetical protein